MPGRTYTTGTSYRYGFNGKENDNEVKGTGNQQDYGMRIYDPRLGRFLSVDPLFKTYPYYTPYQYAGNTPVMATDKDGGEPDPFTWRLINWAVELRLGVPKADNARLLSDYSRSSNNNYGMMDNSAGAPSAQEQIQTNRITAQLNKMALAERTAEYAANSTEFATLPFFIAMPELSVVQAPIQAGLGDYTGAAISSLPLAGKYLGKGFKLLTATATESRAVKGFGIADNFARDAEQAIASIQENTAGKTAQNAATSANAQAGALVNKYPDIPQVAGTQERVFLMPGDLIDRYGGETGRWFSTPGTSFGARSIPPGSSYLGQFKVLKPFEVEKSLANPGFFSGQTGFGIQYESPVGTDILLKRKIISPSTPSQ